MIRAAIILLVGFQMSFIQASAQQVSFGIPTCETPLVKGRAVIMNIPNNSNGRFIPSAELDGLVEFIRCKPSVELRLEINFFHGTHSMSAAYSKHLASNLHDYLIFRDIDSVDVISNGSEKPIFMDEQAKEYKFINTRMEVYVL